MPPPFPPPGDTEKIIVRSYETHLVMECKPGTYLRLLEHARGPQYNTEVDLNPILTSSPPSRIVLRAQALRVLSKLRFAQAVLPVCRLASAGRSSLTYETTLAVDGAPAVVATAVIVQASLETGRKAAIMDEVANAARERIGENSRRGDVHDFGTDPVILRVKDAFPEAGLVGERAYEGAHVVVQSDLDSLEHMNQSRYLELVTDAIAAAGARRFWDPDPELDHAMFEGLCTADISYDGEALFNDRLSIHVWPVPPKIRHWVAFGARIVRAADNQSLCKIAIQMGEPDQAPADARPKL